MLQVEHQVLAFENDSININRTNVADVLDTIYHNALDFSLVCFGYVSGLRSSMMVFVFSLIFVMQRGLVKIISVLSYSFVDVNRSNVSIVLDFMEVIRNYTDSYVVVIIVAIYAVVSHCRLITSDAIIDVSNVYLRY